MKYITVEEASKKLDLSARSIRNYCAQGRIPGATLNGKTWLIPEDVSKPERSNGKEELDYEAIALGEELISFINKSPVSFLAIQNIEEVLKKHGYIEILEGERHHLQVGEKVFFVRNDSTLIALNIGKNVTIENGSFHIVASHTDSPCFKIKPECDSKTDEYNKVNVAPYGGLIAPSFLDRPLGVAGRIYTNTEEGIEAHIVNYSDLVAYMPNLCIHFNKNINDGYTYDMAKDMQAYISLGDSSLKQALAKRLKVKEEEIMNFDLFLYNKEGGLIWGEKKEFLSSPRLDDLECVYVSTKAFVNTTNDNAINVLYLCDNEEVGSLSRQGADSDFLANIIMRTCKDIATNYERSVANSFMVSADNAHAVHPNHPEITDKDNKVYMNRGIAIKFSAANLYTSDALTSSIFQKICNNANVPYQFFANRSNIRGGSTLGKLLLPQVSLMAVDVGLGQLAMHSSYETIGTIDIKYAVKAFTEFYETTFKISKKSVKIIK